MSKADPTNFGWQAGLKTTDPKKVGIVTFTQP
jgi:hypothetical protein